MKNKLLGMRAHLRLGALQAAADHCVTWPVQHPTQLLAQLECSSTHQAWGLAAKPDEDIRPAVQDVHTSCVQQALQLYDKWLAVRTWTTEFYRTHAPLFP